MKKIFIILVLIIVISTLGCAPQVEEVTKFESYGLTEDKATDWQIG